MLKVFLAEDEFVVREGIKNNIDWGAHGYQFCGEAGDGEVAFSMIKEQRPDILITDIKMPFMDGLTLSRLVKAEIPSVEIILLTGYEDFEYAKEAISIGVASYLSKPISGDNLLKEVSKVAKRIEDKNLEKELAKKYEENMRERAELLKQTVDMLSVVPSSYEWALKASAKKNEESSSLSNYEDNSLKDKEVLQEIDPRHIDKKKVKEFLRIGEEEDTERFLEEFLCAMGKNAIRSTMLRQYISMDFYFCVTDFVENELGLSRNEVDALIPSSKLLSDEKATCDYLADIVKKALILRKENSQGRYRDVVNEVIAYIDEHFSDEELSLNTVASHVNFSPNHLSAVFRQETGQTFIKYLTDLRLEKAKELLLSTSKKSNEIGLMVGYKDPHYFSFLFKKTFGMTTTQYRGGKAVEGDL
ncbi:MAG: response regulator [Butyrivibrio sp.]|nr:response regulator [Butyrivibrio sp.]